MDYFELVGRDARSVWKTGPKAEITAGLHSVIGWASLDSVRKFVARGKVLRIGGFGGFIKQGHRWRDYIVRVPEELHSYFEALRASLVLEKIRGGGDWHQNSPRGMPVFDDGAVGMFSFRGWGDLLAATWAEEEDHDYAFTDFYMSVEPD